MAMDRWVGKTAVVTGASAGIGAAIAVSLANAGLKVVGLARRPHLIDELKTKVTGSGSLHSRKCDVSRPEEVAETFAWVKQTFGGTDVLVNNAGAVYHGSITEVSPHAASVDELMQEIDLNVKSVVLCARAAASSMHERNSPGHIIVVNSVLGHELPARPIFNVYPATKYAVTAITQTIRAEFSSYKANIKTTSLSPGLVETAMRDKMTEVAAYPSLQPQDVADAVLYLLSTPPNVNINELTITAHGGL